MGRHTRRISRCTMVRNIHESKRKYWATRSSVRSFVRSFDRTALLASLVRCGAPIHSLAHSLTPGHVGKRIIGCAKTTWFCPTVRFMTRQKQTKSPSSSLTKLRNHKKTEVGRNLIVKQYSQNDLETDTILPFYKSGSMIESYENRRRDRQKTKRIDTEIDAENRGRD